MMGHVFDLTASATASLVPVTCLNARSRTRIPASREREAEGVGGHRHQAGRDRESVGPSIVTGPMPDDRGHAERRRARCPPSCVGVSGWASQMAAATAIVAGVRALRIAASEAWMVCSAKAYSPNGHGRVDGTEQEERPPVAPDGTEARTTHHERQEDGGQPDADEGDDPRAEARAPRRACTGRTRRTWRPGNTG